MNRRKFLKRSGAFLSGLAIGGSISETDRISDTDPTDPDQSPYFGEIVSVWHPYFLPNGLRFRRMHLVVESEKNDDEYAYVGPVFRDDLSPIFRSIWGIE